MRQRAGKITTILRWPKNKPAYTLTPVEKVQHGATWLFSLRRPRATWSHPRSLAAPSTVILRSLGHWSTGFSCCPDTGVSDRHRQRATLPVLALALHPSKTRNPQVAPVSWKATSLWSFLSPSPTPKSVLCSATSVKRLLNWACPLESYMWIVPSTFETIWDTFFFNISFLTRQSSTHVNIIIIFKKIQS